MANTNEAPNTYEVRRITINLPEHVAEKLDELRTWTGRSLTDVLHRAITLYHFTEDAMRRDEIPALVDADTGKVTEIRFL